MIHHDTLYPTTFHAFIPPIRSVSACKGCCFAPRNNHGSQNPIKSWRTWKLWKVECGLYFAAFELNCQQKKGLDHWRYMQALQGLHPLKPGLQGVYSLIGPRLAAKLGTRVPPLTHQRVYSQMWGNDAVRECFVGPYVGVPKLRKMIRIKKTVSKKTPVHGKEGLEC